MIVVAGGYTRPKTFLDTVEILDPASDKGWMSGPKLPYKSACTSMVTSPGGNGVILIGGLIKLTGLIYFCIFPVYFLVEHWAAQMVRNKHGLT